MTLPNVREETPSYLDFICRNKDSVIHHWMEAGASGFGRPVREAAHRPERFARLAGCGEGDAVTPARLAAVLRAEGLHDRVFVNQAETDKEILYAKALAALLDCPVTAGSLWKGEYVSCW